MASQDAGATASPAIAFTEHGAITGATLRGSPRATEISVHVVRAFVQWRSMLATNRALPSKLHTLERARTAYVHHTALATAPQPAGLRMA
jgi:hypothetical protein